jgi:hypothetical protein
VIADVTMGVFDLRGFGVYVGVGWSLVLCVSCAVCVSEGERIAIHQLQQQQQLQATKLASFTEPTLRVTSCERANWLFLHVFNIESTHPKSLQYCRAFITLKMSLTLNGNNFEYLAST